MSTGKWEILRVAPGDWRIFKWHCTAEDCFQQGIHLRFPSGAEAIAAFAAGER